MSAAESELPALPAVTDLPDGFRLLGDGKSVLQRSLGDGVFLPVEFPERVWQDSGYGLKYQVFSSETDRVFVPAVSAIDAIAKSGIEKPFKVVRGMAAEETGAVVIQAGRLVPADDADTDLDGPATDPPADQAGTETGQNPNDQADAAPAPAEAETDAPIEPAGAGPDASAEAADIAEPPEPETEPDPS